MLPNVQLSPEQTWRSTQVDADAVKMTGRGNLGIEVALVGEELVQVPTPASFWKRIWMKMFGPRPPPTFFVAIQRPPNTTVEVSMLRQIRARDDPKAWTDLSVSFRFVPEKKGR